MADLILREVAYFSPVLHAKRRYQDDRKDVLFDRQVVGWIVREPRWPVKTGHVWPLENRP